MRSRWALLIAFSLTLVVAVTGIARQASNGSNAFRFEQIQPDIYAAIGTGSMNVGSNAGIIINRDDVFVVDSHISPDGARVLLREMRSITTKPVRFLINTHFHFDHTDGNQVYSALPVDIIGHEFTRMKLLSSDLFQRGTFANAVAGIPRQIADLRGKADNEKDPVAKARIEQQLRVQQAYASAVKEVRLTPPSVTLRDKMTIIRGDREIQILHFGRGHTAGDVVVYLPKERVLCTGDLLYNDVSYLGDGFVNEWPETLEKVKGLDFDYVIPGHWETFRGKQRLEYFQLYLRDLWQQTAKLHAQGIPAEEAAKRIDMTSHKGRYPSITAPGVPSIAVTRMYDVMAGRID
jgi:cyclase